MSLSPPYTPYLPFIGQGSDGKEYGDSPTLRSELQCPECDMQEIEIPDDVNGGTEKVTLVIFCVLMSFDWLANGDFGPFASSVSARYPCPKCMWTAVLRLRLLAS